MPFYKNHIPWNKGETGVYKKNTLEKMSKARIGTINSEETRKRISESKKGVVSWNKGRHLSDKHKMSLSKSHRGKIAWNKGKTGIYSVEVLKKMSNSMKGRYLGKNHPNWQGGISFETYTFNFNKELKELIRKRDNYKCQLCGMPECENIRKLSIHHIDFNKKNCSPNNLIALCIKCNTKVNSKRDYWTEYFKSRMEKD